MTTDDAESPSHDPREVRRNFSLLSLDAIFYFTALPLLDQSTILPSFLSTLAASPIAIGAIIAIRPAGVFLPQLWAAHYLRHRTRHMSYLLKGASVSRIAIALFALVMFLAGPRDRSLMLWSFIAMYAAFWLSEGAVNVSWMDLTAKAVPERLRGRLFGFIQFMGGLFGIGSGAFAGHMLSKAGPGYPKNYAVIWTVGAVLFVMSFISLSLVREPEGHAEEHDGDFLQYIGKTAKMLAGHGQLKRLLTVQLLMGFLGLSLPFYILYAKEQSGIGGSMVGILLSIQVAGGVVSSAIGGYVSDHHGPKAVIVTAALFGIGAGVLSLAIGESPVWLYGMLFFAVGWVAGSGWIGLVNCLLEMAGPRERKTYIGVQNAANAPTLIFPILGGVIAQVASYRTVFLITALAFALSLLMALGLSSRRAADGG